MKDGDTLGAARAYLRANAAKGCLCPACGGKVKVYRRRLHAEMAQFLVLLVRAYARHQRAGASAAEVWLHPRDVLPASPQAAKISTDGAFLVHWGLVERQPSKRRYRPTHKGVAFVRDPEATVPSHVLLLNNKAIAYEGKTTLRHALGADFALSEVLADANPARATG